MIRTAQIKLDGTGFGSVVIDDIDLSRSACALHLRSAVGEVTRLEVDLNVIGAVEVDAEVELMIPEETRAALIAFGWTPPSTSDLP